MQRRQFIINGLLSSLLTVGQTSVSLAEVTGTPEIVLGQSAPLTGSFSELGKAYRDGALLVFDSVNRQGGLFGRRIKLLTLDDAYLPKRAEDNAHQLIEQNKVIALFGLMFTNTVRASLPIASAAQVPYIAPYAGHDELYAQVNPVLFMMRASFSAELDALLKHIQAMGLTRVALIRYDSSSGAALEKELTAKARAAQLTSLTSATMTLNSRDTIDAVAKLAQARPAAVVLGVSGGDAVAFIRQFNKTTSARPVQYLARSLVGGHQLVAELREESRGVVMSQLVPSPFNGKTRAAREYQTMLKAATQSGMGHIASHIAFEGFLAAKMTVEALRRAGANPSRAALMTALESMRSWDGGDFMVNFSPTDHAGSKFVTVTVIGAGGHYIE